MTKICNAKWTCPCCGAVFILCCGSRALTIDDRENPEDDGDILVIPLSYRPNRNDETHPDYELEKQVESLIDWLKSVSLMDQLSVVNTWENRNVISNTNYMVINRMKASRTVKWRRTKNICKQGETPITTYNAKIVSMAPELSLATIGGWIPVIEVPKDVPMPDIATVAYIMTSIAQMVII